MKDMVEYYAKANNQQWVKEMMGELMDVGPFGVVPGLPFLLQKECILLLASYLFVRDYVEEELAITST